MALLVGTFYQLDSPSLAPGADLEIMQHAQIAVEPQRSSTVSTYVRWNLISCWVGLAGENPNAGR